MVMGLFSCLQILKGKGIKSNPCEIATSIVANVPQNDLLQKVGQTKLKYSCFVYGRIINGCQKVFNHMLHSANCCFVGRQQVRHPYYQILTWSIQA